MSRRSSTRNIRLVLRYDGTHYSGWQFQKNAETVQDAIESALKKITGHKVKLTGAGRTDSGVHAVHQVANFKTHSKLALNKIKDALNSSIPEDILIVSVKSAPIKFDSQRSARSKWYRYTVTTTRFVDPFIRHFAARFSYPLNIRSMKRAARVLTGRHDFKAFQAAGSSELNMVRPFGPSTPLRADGEHPSTKARGSPEFIEGQSRTIGKLRVVLSKVEGRQAHHTPSLSRGTVRTIKKIKIERYGDLVYIDVWADGFLYNMVRIIAGTLLEIGRGKIPEKSIKEILLKRDRMLAGPTAPARGLCLMNVEY